MLLFFKSSYAEGNTEPRKRKKKCKPPPPRVESSMSRIQGWHATTEPPCNWHKQRWKDIYIYIYIQKAWQGNYPNSVVTQRVLWLSYDGYSNTLFLWRQKVRKICNAHQITSQFWHILITHMESPFKQIASKANNFSVTVMVDFIYRKQKTVWNTFSLSRE